MIQFMLKNTNHLMFALDGDLESVVVKYLLIASSTNLGQDHCVLAQAMSMFLMQVLQLGQVSTFHNLTCTLCT